MIDSSIKIYVQFHIQTGQKFRAQVRYVPFSLWNAIVHTIAVSRFYSREKALFSNLHLKTPVKIFV